MDTTRDEHPMTPTTPRPDEDMPQSEPCGWCGEVKPEREIINGHCYLCRMGTRRQRTPAPTKDETGARVIALAPASAHDVQRLRYALQLCLDAMHEDGVTDTHEAMSVARAALARPEGEATKSKVHDNGFG